MKTTLQKWGNSQGVRVPKSMLEHLGLDVGSAVALEISDAADAITIRPFERSRPVHGRHRIEDLVARIPRGSKSKEMEWGEPQGGEVW